MLQQVYNTTRVQQENSKRYDKSTARGTASLYDIVILLIFFINTLNIGKHRKKFFPDTLFFFDFIF